MEGRVGQEVKYDLIFLPAKKVYKVLYNSRWDSRSKENGSHYLTSMDFIAPPTTTPLSQDSAKLWKGGGGMWKRDDTTPS